MESGDIMNQSKRMFFLLPFLLLICLVTLQFLGYSLEVQHGKGLFSFTNVQEDMAYGIVNVSSLHNIIYMVQMMMGIYFLFHITNYIRIDFKKLEKSDIVNVVAYVLVTISFIYFLPYLIQDVLNIVTVLFK